MCIRDRRQARQRRIKTETAYRKPTPAWMRIAGNLIMGLLIVAALVGFTSVSYTHLRAHETVLDLVCRLLLEKKKNTIPQLRSHCLLLLCISHTTSSQQDI